MAGIKLIPYTVRVQPTEKTDNNDFWDLTALPQNPSVQAELGKSNSTTALTDVADFIDLIENSVTSMNQNIRTSKKTGYQI